MTTGYKQVKNGTQVPESSLSVKALEHYFNKKVLLINNKPIVSQLFMKLTKL